MGLRSTLTEWMRSINWGQLLTWQFLKDPFAICCAVLSGALIGILSNAFDPTNTLNLVWIVTTVLLVMTFGSAEKILVEAIFRILGTVIGVGVGALVAFGHSELVNSGSSTVALYAYQLSLQVAFVFMVAVGVKLFPRFHDVFVIIGLTIAVLLFSPNLVFAKSRTLSVLLATGVAFACTILFHFTMSEELLFLQHEEAATNLMRLTRLAVSSEHKAKHEFDLSAHQIRGSLRSAKDTWSAYVQWRKLTLRSVRYDFGALSESLRPLYYEVFSLYWSHTETNLRPRDAKRLYCDTEADYEILFKPLIRSIVEGVRKCAFSLQIILRPTKVPFMERKEQLEKLVSIMAIDFLLNLTLMNVRYTDNRLLCFSTRNQRWNMCDFMITVSCVLMELVEYFRAVVGLFAHENASEYGRLSQRLVKLKESLNALRFETHSLLDILPIMVVPSRE